MTRFWLSRSVSSVAASWVPLACRLSRLEMSCRFVLHPVVDLLEQHHLFRQRVLDLLVRSNPLGDVPEGHHDTDGRAGAPDRGAHVIDWEARPVLAPECFVCGLTDQTVADRAQHRTFVGRVGRSAGRGVMNELMEVLSNELGNGPAKHPGRSGVDEGGLSIEVESEDALAHRAEDQVEGRLGLFQLLAHHLETAALELLLRPGDQLAEIAIGGGVAVRRRRIGQDFLPQSPPPNALR